jgi:hypothetical protein
VLLTLTNPVLLFVGDPFMVIDFSLDDWFDNGDLASAHPRYDIMTTDGEGEGESVEKACGRGNGRVASQTIYSCEGVSRGARGVRHTPEESSALVEGFLVHLY